MRRVMILLLIVMALLGTTSTYGIMPVKPSALQWDPPTTYISGAPIGPSEIGGYQVYCGLTAGNYTTVKDVGNVTSVPLSTILTADGVYHCVVTAYSAAGIESGYSNEVTIPLDSRVPAAPVLRLK